RKLPSKARARLAPQLIASVGQPPNRDTGSMLVSTGSGGCRAPRAGPGAMEVSRATSEKAGQPSHPRGVGAAVEPSRDFPRQPYERILRWRIDERCLA